MRHITVPASIRLVNHHTGEPSEPRAFEWRTFMLVLLNDPRMLQKQTDVARLIKIVDVVSAAKDGDVLALEDSDHDMVRAVAEDPFVANPRTGQRVPYWEPLTMVQIQSFFDAILSAPVAPKAPALKAVKK